MLTKPAIAASNYETLVQDCLRILTRFTQARQAHLLILKRTEKINRDLFSWYEDTAPPLEPSQPPLRLDSSWWLRSLRAENMLVVEQVGNLPDLVANDRDALLAQGIQALILLPVYDGKRLIGTVRLENPATIRPYTSAETDLLQIAAQLIVQVLFVSYDIAEMKRDRAQLVYRNSHDEHTGLPNQSLFQQRIRSAFDSSSRLFAVVLVNFDYYQLIHERFGLETGKRLVDAAVGVLKSNLRAGDMVSRLSPEEFGILLEDLQEGGFAELVAQRILDQLKQPFVVDGQRVTISARIGIALRNGHQRTADLVLQEAGIALIQARLACSNKYCVFNLSMRDQLIGRMEMESDLRNSLDHKHLVLHYQPITEMQTGRLIGFEALVRWLHPQRGLIWPSEFIQLSEETGLIIPLGLWVLREACRQMRIWQECYPLDDPLTISVNISPRQLEQLEFSDQVAEIMAETGLPPTSLRLEITENTLVNSSCVVMETLDSLRGLGVQLYIDDFGTGYSSLGYLDSLPIDAIKIDRAFVTNLGRVKSSAGVVQAIIQLAHELNIEVVAEGVETFEQHKELKRLQCEFMQGFYISEPLDSLAVERYITGRAIFNPSVV